MSRRPPNTARQLADLVARAKALKTIAPFVHEQLAEAAAGKPGVDPARVVRNFAEMIDRAEGAEGKRRLTNAEREVEDHVRVAERIERAAGE